MKGRILRASWGSYTFAALFFACSNQGDPSDGSGSGGEHSAAGGSGGEGGPASGGAITGDGGVSGSGSAAGSGSASESFVPSDVNFGELADEGEGVDVVAATLTQGSDGLEFYAALHNGGDTGACGGALSIELFDAQEQSLGVFDAGLFGKQIYRINELDQVVGCIDPDSEGAAAVLNIDEELRIDDIAHVTYRFTYFSTEFFEGGLTLLEEFKVTGLNQVPLAFGISFSGTLENGLEVPATEPSVTIFALNDIGRPLGVVAASRAEALAAHDEWTFQTGPIVDPGVTQWAFPLGSIQF